MAKEVYNLQVPIDLNLAETLKQLADEDDRNLRSYCRRVLQDHVKNLGKEISNISIKDKTKEIKEVMVENGATQESVELAKKKRVGKLIKK